MEKEEIIVNKTRKKRSTLSTNLLILAIKLLILIFVYLVFFRLVFAIMRMDSPNMNPTINEGELLILFRLEQKYDIGDTVLVEQNNKKYILRIVAIENQKIEISDDNTLLVDGSPEDHLVYYSTKKDTKSKLKYPYTVEPNKFFVLNDYRTNEEDSRSFGTITKDQIKGKVIGKIQVRDI